jgi:hypothetical protein
MVSGQLSKEGKRRTLFFPIQRGIFFGALSLAVYLFIVVITTPSLSSIEASAISFEINWWAIVGLSFGTGIQTFLITYSKERACNLRARRCLFGISGFSSVFSSFFSFFALIPVGCCGTWLYIISFLPGVFGTAASGILIDYSQALVIAGFILMAASIVYTYLSIRRGLTNPIFKKSVKR